MFQRHHGHQLRPHHLKSNGLLRRKQKVKVLSRLKTLLLKVVGFEFRESLASEYDFKQSLFYVHTYLILDICRGI